MINIFSLFRKIPNEIQLNIITLYIGIDKKQEINELHYLINKSYLINKFFDGCISVPNNVFTHKLSFFNSLININKYNHGTYNDYHLLNLFLKLVSLGFEIIEYNLRIKHDGYDEYGAKYNLYFLDIICVKDNIQVSLTAYRDYYFEGPDSCEYFLYKNIFSELNSLCLDWYEDDLMNENDDDLMNENDDDLMNENEYTNMENKYIFNEIKFKEENFLQYVKKNINEKDLIFVFNRL